MWESRTPLPFRSPMYRPPTKHGAAHRLGMPGQGTKSPALGRLARRPGPLVFLTFHPPFGPRIRRRSPVLADETRPVRVIWFRIGLRYAVGSRRSTGCKVPSSHQDGWHLCLSNCWTPCWRLSHQRSAESQSPLKVISSSLIAFIAANTYDERGGIANVVAKPANDQGKPSARGGRKTTGLTELAGLPK